MGSHKTYLLTPWSRVLLENLTDFQLVNIFPAFYGNRSFITAITSTLSRASSIQSIFPHPLLRSIVIISSHLRPGLPSGFFPSGFPTKTLYTPLQSPIRATCSSHLILLDFITRKIFGEEYRSLSSSLYTFIHSLVTSSLLGPNIILNTLFSNTLSLRISMVHLAFFNSIIDECQHMHFFTFNFKLFSNFNEVQTYSLMMIC